MRQNLVVVRAGPASLHHGWLSEPYAERNFDLLVSFYSEEAFAKFEPQEGVRAMLVTGGKWDGLFRTLQQADIDAYDRFWLPDDDIKTTPDTINKLFQMCRQHALAVAQPALTRDSYYSHFIFSQCPGFKIRYTNYIEIMVPCLSREILKRVLPFFEGTMSGYGLDYIWCLWPESGAYRVAIVDAVSVHHTRPVGKVLKSAMAANGSLSSEQEGKRLNSQLNLIGRTVPLAFGGISDDGTPVIGCRAMAWRMCKAWWSERKDFRDQQDALWGIVKVARRQLIRRVKLCYLQEVKL